jgi:monofunctional chorismate mutase
MENFRKEIDECDRKLVNALIERFKVVKKIGDYKKANNLPIVDKEREKKVYEKVRNLAGNDINPDIIENIYRTIIASAVNLEEQK